MQSARGSAASIASIAFLICLFVIAPYASAVIVADGDLFVGSAGDTRVKRFDRQTGAFESNLATLAATPFGIAFGPADDLLYVAIDGEANRVQRLDPVTGADLGPFSQGTTIDRKSTRLNSSHGYISYAVFCLKKKN